MSGEGVTKSDPSQPSLCGFQAAFPLLLDHKGGRMCVPAAQKAFPHLRLHASSKLCLLS